MKPVILLATILIVIGGVVAVVYGVALRAPRVHQPIQFNHVVHLEDAGITCDECHTSAATGVYAGIPGKAVCFDCHDPDDEDEEDTHSEKTKLYAFNEVDEDIPWCRVATTRPDVFFSHRRHVTMGKIECLECHVDQAGLTAPPPTARLVMSMEACIACHDKSGASHDCLVCHR